MADGREDYGVRGLPLEAHARGRAVDSRRAAKPCVGGATTRSLRRKSLHGRIGLVTGKFRTVAQLIADAKPPPDATGEQAALGRYLARTICTSCHGTDLRGASTPDFVAPDLRIAGAYSLEQFTDLIGKGEGLGGRNLPTMRPWVRKALSQFKDEGLRRCRGICAGCRRCEFIRIAP
jgi:cytochrome c553